MRAAREAALRDCAARGLTRKEAAAELGLSYQVAAKSARLWGIVFAHSNSWTRDPKLTARNTAMADLYRSGQTLEEIGAVFGVTRERVRQIISGMGVTKADGGAAVRLTAARRTKLLRQHQRCMARYGCSPEQLAEIRNIGRAMIAEGHSRYRTPMQAFRQQHDNARRRGIGWHLKLWDWWSIWQASGKWEERGRGQGYVMARYGDAGPYALGNVSIISAAQNASDANRKNDLPMGVREHRGRFWAIRNIDGQKRHLGTFATPQEAHAAYLRAAPAAQAAA